MAAGTLTKRNDRLGSMVPQIPFSNGFLRGTEGRRFVAAEEPE